MKIIDIRVNCEQNSLLYLVELVGKGACHTKEKGKNRKICFYRRIKNNNILEFI